MVHQPVPGKALFSRFAASFDVPGLLDRLRNDLIGADVEIPGPYGPHRLIYADYIGSGRALRHVERFVLESVLPFYANSHSEASFCGSYITSLRREARMTVARSCRAGPDYATIFTGAGATAGLNRLPHLLGVLHDARFGTRPVVFVGPYEHHSNILPWRESGAEIVEIPEARYGGPDLDALEAALAATEPQRLRVGAFSAASNVTGIVTDVDAVSSVLRRHGALSVWDYACGGPYLPIDMRTDTPFRKDVVVISPHKFAGGPGASGVLIVRKDVVRNPVPTMPGGGTVRFVSSSRHDYWDSIEAREESGTPNIVGDIRAALCFIVKGSMPQHVLDARHAVLRQRALARWTRNPDIVLLGNPTATRALPIFSFQIRDRLRGGFVHQLLATRILSDLHGIQARGGCSCAGPYGHHLLGIGPAESDAIRDAIFMHGEMAKPGWSRLNLSALLEDDKVDLIIDAVDSLPENAQRLGSSYAYDSLNNAFQPAPNSDQLVSSP